MRLFEGKQFMYKEMRAEDNQILALVQYDAGGRMDAIHLWSDLTKSLIRVDLEAFEACNTTWYAHFQGKVNDSLDNCNNPDVRYER